MTDEQHRPGVQEAHLVVRHLKLEGLEPGQSEALATEVAKTFGVDTVSIDANSHTLHVAYDAAHCKLDGIEAIVRKHGADIAHDWWTEFREGYYRFVDDNIRDNVERQPWTCHQVPGGTHLTRRRNMSRKR